MALKLQSLVVTFLTERAEQKFTARKIAEWIFTTFPAECHDKKANSSFIKTDADLVQQLVAEISSSRPAIQKKNPQIKTTESRPRQYYWTAKSDQVEINEAEENQKKSAPGGGRQRKVISTHSSPNTFGLSSAFTRSGSTKRNPRTSEARGATSGSIPMSSEWKISPQIGIKKLGGW